MWPAATFEARTSDPERVADALATTFRRFDGPAGGVVFVCGQLVEALPNIAAAVAKRSLGRDLVIAAGTGVISERGEIERDSAATGLVWRGGRARARAMTGDDFNRSCVRLVEEYRDAPVSVLFAFVHHRIFDASGLDVLSKLPFSQHVVGGGTVGSHGAATVSSDGEVQIAPVVTLALEKIAPPTVRVAHACRKVADFQPVTSADGTMLFEIGGRPALEVLNEVGAKLSNERLVFTLVTHSATDDNEYVVRGIQGIDPSREALMLSAEVDEGARVGFAVRSPTAAREALQTSGREIIRATAGAAPGFGIYVNCAGRGSGLYGAADVDIRILTERFGDIPIVGMQSAFEIAPHLGAPQLQLYTGVFSLFTIPS